VAATSSTSGSTLFHAGWQAILGDRNASAEHLAPEFDCELGRGAEKVETAPICAPPK